MAMNKPLFPTFPPFLPQLPQIPQIPLIPQQFFLHANMPFMPNFANILDDKIKKETIENPGLKCCENPAEVAKIRKFENSEEFEKFEKFRKNEKTPKKIEKTREKQDKSSQKLDKSSNFIEKSCEKCRKSEKASEKLEKTSQNLSKSYENSESHENFSKRCERCEICEKSEKSKKIMFSSENSENLSKSFENSSIPSKTCENCDKASEKPLIYEKNEGILLILRYFIQNIGRVRSNRLNVEREKYMNNSDLLLIFDLLMKKYIMSNKTKEEKIKYILRKAFKFLGNKLKNTNSLAKNVKSKKEFDKIFNDFYMKEKTKRLENENLEKKEDFLKEKLIFT